MRETADQRVPRLLERVVLDPQRAGPEEVVIAPLTTVSKGVTPAALIG